MTIAFNKYQGAGNDFIMIDNRNGQFNPEDFKLINKLCDRRFGIGADGLILITNSDEFDFEMIYFNSDGYRGTMCGNGGRCAADFAIKSNIAGNQMKFNAADGVHDAEALDGLIRLKMNDVKETRTVAENYFINTGSPHYVLFTNGLDNLDVFQEGSKLRWSEEFQPGGTNVNFVETEKDGIYVRTFERGVEDETLSCGTGVTASAIASVLTGHFVRGPINVRTKGGNLRVEFVIEGGMAKNIWLTGPATFVFEGKINI
ncbi:MAG TPA: diaminopimelate epimerase [Bacteroidales bacterium]|nr:diaminopimelate epimerase [Bacteroidales bacterium]HBZ21463.1 diaminopimelate epimerase [Bacteroidales bacterium]